MNKMHKIELGKCPCCNKPVADPKSYYGNGMLAGQAKALKSFKDNAYKGVFITSLGTQVHMVLCDTCINAIKPDTLRHLWDYVIQGMILQSSPEYREAVGASRLNETQLDIQSKEIMKLRGHMLLGLYSKRKVKHG